MPRFTDQFVQQVVQATDIVELISQYVALKHRGREFIGLCPFHDDKNPSMYVSPAKQIFKCFACGAGGDSYKFMMLYEKLSFTEAVTALAERAHIMLPRESAAGGDGPQELSRSELLRAMAFAGEFFKSQLASPAGAKALEYARGRGLTDESIERFGLGFAAESWDALLKAALLRGFSEAQLLAAGLVTRREGAGQGGCYDRFRNRLIFPIMDVQGRVIAFGGRALDQDDHAKYLNSPDTVLFDKSASLYGLNWSREAIASSGQAVVVEGYLDALMPLQAGLGGFVATLGTALTDRHVAMLARYARQVVLVFDADEAGTRAAERGLEMFLAQQMHVRVASVPAGKDPCDYTLSSGAQAMQRVVDEAPDALQYVWQRREQAYRQAGGDLAGRQRLVEDFLRLVASSSVYGTIDDVRRGQLAQHIAHLLNIPAAQVQQRMRQLVRAIPRRSGEGGPVQEPAGQAALAERQVLEVLLNRPDLFDSAAERVDPSDFADGPMRCIAQFIWARGAAGRLSTEEIFSSQEMAGHGELLAELAWAGERRGNHEQTLAGAVEHLLYRRNRRQLQELKSSGYSDEVLGQLVSKLRQSDARRHPGIS